MSQAEIDLLVSGAQTLGVPLSTKMLDAMMQLIDQLEHGNAQFNLTAIRDRLGMLQKHLLDSLSMHGYLRGRRIADVGTGAGFPGLPLAIANPERSFTLIESTGKKARFVARTAVQIGCENVEVVNRRAEAYQPTQLFDSVVARALSSMPEFVARAGHLCSPQGRMLAMKGKISEEELAGIGRSFRIVAVHRIEIPGLAAQRHVIELARS
jgi:16S rRNA (guanine527-N7)-methyltransferase